MRTCLRNPDKVAGLILVDPFIAHADPLKRSEMLQTAGKPGSAANDETVIVSLQCQEGCKTL